MTPSEAEYEIQRLLDKKKEYILKIVAVEERIREIIIDTHINCSSKDAETARISATTALEKIRLNSKA